MAVATHTSTHEARGPAEIDLIDLSDNPITSVEQEWCKRILPNWQSEQHGSRASHLIHLGVPRAVQSELWWIGFSMGSCSDERAFRHASSLAERLREDLRWDWDGRRKKSRPYSELLVVDADVPRTRPEKQRTGELCTVELLHLLEALVAADADDGKRGDGESDARGYVQGLADVAALFLLHGMPAWQAFDCLRAIGSRPLLQPLLALDTIAWETVCGVFSRHLSHNLPTLAAHFDELGLLPSFYLPEWLVPLWCRSLCPEAAVLVLNLLLLEGDLSLIRAALGVVRALAPQLLELDDLTECRQLLANGSRELSVSAFRACLLSCAVEPNLCTPLAPWLHESEAKPNGGTTRRRSHGLC